jgi:hypothetical protein
MKLSEEHKLKISNSLKGRTVWNKGVPHTEETKQKISKNCKGKNKGRIFSEEHKRKIGNSRLGKKHTEESKLKCSLVNKGRILSEEHKEKVKHIGNKNGFWKGGYSFKNIPLFNTYYEKLKLAEECRRDPIDYNILQTKCTYCGEWFTPTTTQVYERIRCLNGTSGESRLYCSDKCKIACPIYKKILYPEGYNLNPAREVQVELRQLRFEKDKYICQKCFKNKNELEVPLHCHHKEGIRWNPLESADVDATITVCETCHLIIHSKTDCGYNDLKCSEVIRTNI